MNIKSKTKNPKKLRRAAKAQLDRELAIDAVLNLYHAALDANAPIMAEKIINIRGGITFREAKALVRLVNTEADVNHSTSRVILRIPGAKYGVI